MCYWYPTTNLYSKRPRMLDRAVSNNQSAKRKADDELSNNPHTVKVRACRQKLDSITIKVEKARDNDRHAVKYHIEWKLKPLAAYLNADQSEQDAMEAQVKAEVMAKRHILQSETTKRLLTRV